MAFIEGKPQPGLGDILGGQLKSALGQIGQVKLQQMMQRHQQAESAKGFKAAGLPEGLAYLPQQVQAAYVKNYMKRPGDEALGNALNLLDPESTAAPQPIAGYKQDNNDQLTSLLGISKPGDTLGQDIGIQPEQQSMAQEQPKLSTSKAETPIIQSTAPMAKISAMTAEKKQALNQLLKQLTPAQRKQFEAEKSKREKDLRLEQREIDKEYKPYVTETGNKAKGAKDANLRLDRMEKLINTKNLSRPRFVGLLNTLKKGVFGFGADFTSLLTPESQEFDKLSQDMVKGIKDVFGSKILQTEVDNFMKTIPSLTQNREGKKRVIYDLRLMNEASMTKDAALKQIRAANGGHIPPNVDDLVDKIAGPKLDAIADKLREGWKKPEKEPKPSKGIMDYVTGDFKNPATQALNLIFGKG